MINADDNVANTDDCTTIRRASFHDSFDKNFVSIRVLLEEDANPR